MNIIIVRHGQTDWNKEDLLQGHTDILLNENGIIQAKETAKLLKNIHIDEIYVSPLLRTISTANEININRNLKLNIDNRLIERGFGNFEGIDGKKVNMKKYWDLELNLSDNNVESIKDLFNRVYSFLDEILKKYENSEKTILIVTHNGANLAFSSLLFGKKDNIFEYNLKPCEYKIFENVKKENLYGKY